ncbi:histone deacetylase complex subunit SAP18 isoform X1 [Silene latifolia]|uniref:histone deacetylase complex subunit SAP18 isoform X1 n=1 Tax=Silene latifolia TaxID=37657 RepID=UPI003D76F017
MAGNGARPRRIRRQKKTKRPPQQTPPLPPSTAVSRGAVFVEREKTCPMLLRVFAKIGSHHNMEDFAVGGKEPKSEFQIYTWKDATLRELTSLVREAIPQARRRDALLSFALVYPDRNGCFIVRRVGKTLSHCTRALDDEKTLAQLRFQIGDYLDVAIFLTGACGITEVR